MHEGIAQLAELYSNCFRQPRQPLQIGIHNDIIARHPELQPGLIASALRTYTRSVGYLETLKANAARIDLEGNPVGTVTAADEGDAERKIAKAARRAAAKAIEERKGKSATVADLPSSPVAATPQPIAPAGPPRLGLAGLKAAAPARRAGLVASRLYGWPDLAQLVDIGSDVLGRQRQSPMCMLRQSHESARGFERRFAGL